MSNRRGGRLVRVCVAVPPHAPPINPPPYSASERIPSCVFAYSSRVATSCAVRKTTETFTTLVTPAACASMTSFFDGAEGYDSNDIRCDGGWREGV